MRRAAVTSAALLPHLPLVFHADGNHGKPEVFAWLEREELRYVICDAPKGLLRRQSTAHHLPGRTQSMSGSSSTTSRRPERRSSMKT
jgi:hypothetical protein